MGLGAFLSTTAYQAMEDAIKTVSTLVPVQIHVGAISDTPRQGHPVLQLTIAPQIMPAVLIFAYMWGLAATHAHATSATRSMPTINHVLQSTTASIPTEAAVLILHARTLGLKPTRVPVISTTTPRIMGRKTALLSTIASPITARVAQIQHARMEDLS